MRLFEIDPHANEENNLITVSIGVEMVEFTNGDTQSVGIPLGNFAKPNDDGKYVPKFFKVYNAIPGDILEFIDVSKMDVHGMRFGIKPKNPNENSANDMACIVMHSTKPEGKMRLLNAATLRDQGILMEGKIHADNTKFTTRNPPYCCPSVLFAFAGDRYSFQYWNDATQTMRVVTFHYDGEKVVIDSNIEKESKFSNPGFVRRSGSYNNDQSYKERPYKPRNNYRNDDYHDNRDDRRNYRRDNNRDGGYRGKGNYRNNREDYNR